MVLDGFLRSDWRPIVMTTNHIEKLDERYCVPEGSTTSCTWERRVIARRWNYNRRFFPELSETEAREFVEASRHTETMAEFQRAALGLEQEERRLDSRGNKPRNIGVEEFRRWLLDRGYLGTV